MRDKIQSWFFFNDDKKEHIKALDGLRGMAVILVLLSHASNNDIFFHKAISFNGIGHGGVYLFYVLSAYLLDRQISLALMRHSADSFFWFRYFLRRFLRIYPLFILSLLFYWLLSNLGLTTVINDGMTVVKHILLLSGKSVFWSIPVEFKYYLLSPFILLVCHFYLKWDLVKLGLFFMILSMGMLVVDYFFPFEKISTLKHLIIFLTGTFIAIYNIIAAPPKWILKLGKGIGFAGLTGLLFCLIMNPDYMRDWLGIGFSNYGRKVMVMYACLCGIMLFAAIYDQDYFKAFLENKFLRFIGVISFSIYLFHLPVIIVIKQEFMSIPDALKIYIYLLVTVVFSTFTYLMIERPLSRIRISKRS